MKTIKHLSLFMLAFLTAVIAIANPVAGFALATSGFGAGALNPDIRERAHKFLTDVMTGTDAVSEALRNKIGADVLREYQAGKLGVFQSPYYFRKEFVTSDRVFIRNTDDMRDGYTNIDKARLEKDQVLILTDLRIQWAQALTSGSPTADSVLYSDQVWDLTSEYAAGTVDLASGVKGAVAVQRIPTKIVNGEFEFNCGPELILADRFSNYFVNNLNGTQTHGNEYPSLRSPKIIKGNTALEFITKIPAGGTWPASTSFFMELSFGGIILRPING